MPPEFTDNGAAFSADRRFRYSLWRWWKGGNKQKCCFIMLNPSTADENVLDPTVTRCVGFAEDWGFSGIIVVNLFALRATDPKELYEFGVNPNGGIENNQAIGAAVMQSACVVCAWGVHGALWNRGEDVKAMLDGFELACLGTTKDGHPKHPLYLRRDTQRRPFGQRMLATAR